ncbi:MAG TPA: glycosyltransferase family 4 protein [Thermoflexales bacterium]|nr:glycosyltransferase family 4 protein [Thermoflexales bacterium]HQZ55453.1 glycosyltransferase family 4 protein [Thermoflexales bacterium]
MRIAFIAGEYPPLQGGLGDFTRELARASAQAGHAPTVLTRTAAGAPARETERGVSIQRLVDGWGWGTAGAIGRYADGAPADVFDLQFQAAAYGMHPAMHLLPGKLRRRAPVVVTFHDLRVPYLFPKAGPLRWQAMLALARAAAGVIVTNPEDGATLRAAGLARVREIPIGSNITPATLAGFELAAWRAARGIPAATDLIGYFGFLNESKGGDTLLRALAALRGQGRDVGLLLIGGQTGASDATNIAYARALEELAARLNVTARVFRTGFVDDRGVLEAFAACVGLALPYRDGVSLRRGTLMAAFAHGAPIVTTTPRLPIAGLADGEAFLLVPPDDPPALAAALARLLDDGALRASLRAGSLRASGRFAWPAIAAETVAFFRACGAQG